MRLLLVDPAEHQLDRVVADRSGHPAYLAVVLVAGDKDHALGPGLLVQLQEPLLGLPQRPRELVRAIQAYVEWKATADAILDKVARTKSTLDKMTD